MKGEMVTAVQRLYLAMCHPRFFQRTLAFALPAAIVGAAFFAPDVLAQSRNWGDIGGSVADQGDGIARAVRILVYIMGFGMVGSGLFLWATASKKNQPMSWGIMLTIFGSLMLVVNLVVQSTSQTFFGVDPGSEAGSILGD